MTITESLDKALALIEETKYHVLARQSVFDFPECYNLGRESVYMSCEYGHKIKDLLSALYYKEVGVCPICEETK